MKGHVGGGPQSGQFGVRVLWLNTLLICPLNVTTKHIAPEQSGAKYAKLNVVQTDKLLKRGSVSVGFGQLGQGFDHELESLILAQNERWRHA